MEKLELDNEIGMVEDEISSTKENLIYVPHSMYEIIVNLHFGEMQNSLLNFNILFYIMEAWNLWLL